MRALVIAAPTVDLLGGRARPGGPGLYAGTAAARAGCEAHALGPAGQEDVAGAAKAHGALGVRLHSVQSPGPSYTFEIRYTPSGRVMGLAGRPGMACLGEHQVIPLIEEVDPDVVIVAPVHGEAPPGLLPLIRHAARDALVALDPQGYSRVYGASWPHAIPRGSYDLLHYSTDDPQPPKAPPGLVLLTDGARPGVVLLDGSPIARIPEPPRVLDDPTGAGDAFTALTACCTASTWDPTECAARAAQAVPGVLEEAHSRLEGLAGPPSLRV